MLKKLLITISLLLEAGVIYAADRDFLWKKVNEECVPNQIANNIPSPCARVNLKQEFALYKVDNDPYQLLLIPTVKITGIEDPNLQHGNITNYLYHAWQARNQVTRLTGPSVDIYRLSLTVNPNNARSQDQLHIHISCLKEDVLHTINGLPKGELDGHWHSFSMSFSGHRYEYRKISLDELASNKIFIAVKHHANAAKKDIAFTTFAIAQHNQGSLLIIQASGDIKNPVPAESLQDHSCGLTHQ